MFLLWLHLACSGGIAVDAWDISLTTTDVVRLDGLELGSTASAPFQVDNGGNDSAELTLSVTEPFSLSETTGVVGPGDSFTGVVSVMLDARERVTGTLVLSAQDGLSRSVELVATADADQDGDGHDDAALGGSDCDDDDPTLSPDATEVPYDGVDQDCDGADLVDVDEDGFSAETVGGDDCNDDDPDVHPAALDAFYDGIDQDCDGRDDDDADGDGVDVSEDCDDADPLVSSDC